MSHGELFAVSAVATILAVALLPALKNFGLPGPTIV